MKEFNLLPDEPSLRSRIFRDQKDTVRQTGKVLYKNAWLCVTMILILIAIVVFLYCHDTGISTGIKMLLIIPHVFITTICLNKFHNAFFDFNFARSIYLAYKEEL